MMSPSAIEKVKEKRKWLTEEKKSMMIQAGGSIKTKNYIDSHEICREVRYGYG